MTTKPKKVYCIAICGMGMGSLAGLLKAAGHDVSGSDANTYPPMSDQLRRSGITVHEGYAAEHVPRDADLVIVGNAISKGHVEVEQASRLDLRLMSMPDAIAEFFLQQHQSIVVAGTHGKTTTTALMAWLLSASDQDPTFLVGGVLKNFDRSWGFGHGPYFVIEGDEYDTAFFDKTPKFLHYKPTFAILNPIEFDHADIYKDLDAVLEAFRRFVGIIPESGHLFACGDSRHVRDIIAKTACATTLFGQDDDCHYQIIKATEGATNCEIEFRDSRGQVRRVRSPMVGRHNALNLLGVIACLDLLKIDPTLIQKGLDQFSGIKRRQEVRGIVRDITVIDDFAHHPTAVAETLEALRLRYPKGRLWAVFEPRSNTSRTKIFQEEFPTAFRAADEVLLAPPYDNGKIGREQLLDIKQVARDIVAQGRRASATTGVAEIVQLVGGQAKSGDVIAILSNGSFGGIHEKLIDRLKDAS